MKIYDSIIKETLDSLDDYQAKVYKPDEGKLWKDEGVSTLIMQKEAAYELGGSNLESANYTMVTSSDLINADEILVVGPDLAELSKDTPFLRVSIVKTSEDLKSSPDKENLSTEEVNEQNKAYNSVKNLEFVRYHVYPKGYMIRVSAMSHREQVRISKAAIAAGISFARIGSLYIKRYKQRPGVLNAKVIFITDGELVHKLSGNAKKVDDITKTLDHILDGMALDCGHCHLKPICDEVEGMREEHMKSIEANKNN